MSGHRLEVVPMSLADIPFRVLSQAFWRPQALRGGRLADNVVEADLLRTVDRLGLQWRAEESWVNNAVDAIYGALPPRAIAQIMRRLMPDMSSELLVPSTCGSTALKPFIGVPDLFLVSKECAVAAEIKIGAKSSNGRYSFEQYTKYFTLAMLLRASRREDLPRKTLQLLVVPSLDPARFCLDHGNWHPRVEEGWLTFDPGAVRYADRRKRFNDFAAWRSTVVQPLKKASYVKANDIDEEVVATLEAGLISPEMQVRVVTWDELMRQTAEVAEGFGMGHLCGSFELVRKLGMGI